MRRAGPNYQEGLRMMRDTAKDTGLPIHIYGPETHVTAVVPLALGLANIEEFPEFDDPIHNLPSVKKSSDSKKGKANLKPSPLKPQIANDIEHKVSNFNASTRCVVYGLQNRAVQGMLDFDFMCKRTKPSVAAMIFPFSANHFIKFYWGTEEILVPVYQDMGEAFEKHPDVTVMVNFSSFRSVYSSVMETLKHPTIKSIAIIAEGVPESQTRAINKAAHDKGVGIIGPATVGGIKVSP